MLQRSTILPRLSPTDSVQDAYRYGSNYYIYNKEGVISNLRRISTAVVKNKQKIIKPNSILHTTSNNSNKISKTLSTPSLSNIEKTKANTKNMDSEINASIIPLEKAVPKSSKPYNKNSHKNCISPKRASSTPVKSIKKSDDSNNIISNIKSVNPNSRIPHNRNSLKHNTRIKIISSKPADTIKEDDLFNSDLTETHKKRTTKELNITRFLDPKAIDSILERSRRLMRNHEIYLDPTNFRESPSLVESYNRSLSPKHSSNFDYFENRMIKNPHDFTLENRSRNYKDGYLARLKNRHAKNNLRDIPDTAKKHSYIYIYSRQQYQKKKASNNEYSFKESPREKIVVKESPREMIETNEKQRKRKTIFDDLENIKTNIKIMPTIIEMNDEEFEIFKQQNRDAFKIFLELFNLAKQKLNSKNSNKVFSEIIDQMDIKNRNEPNQIAFIEALKRLFLRLTGNYKTKFEEDDNMLAQNIIENKDSEVETDVDRFINMLNRYDTNLNIFNNYIEKIDKEETVDNNDFMDLYSRHQKLNEKLAKNRFEFDLGTIV